ncbi:MAG TPA: ketoacyl-ACP synthase III [Verrucomicrobiae bacterium]|nr:ketoacyl-ACP synthase III [Verrucomicrobiae bacterium]
MKHIFRNKKIGATVTVVPKEERRFDDEYPGYKLTEEKAKKFKKMMGVDRHRIAAPDVTASDLCLCGTRWLLDRGLLKKEEIGAVLFVSQTPDYFIPPTSNVLQGVLGLDHDVIALDINQGCTGFLVGLLQAFLMLEMPSMRKILLLNGDTCSKQMSRFNRINYPLTGDAGSATIIERCEEDNPIFCLMNMDGTRHQALMIPAGAYRQPSTPETLVPREVEEGVVRSLQHMQMDGPAIFNFTMEDVPKQIEAALSFSGDSRDSIEYFLLHQPNEFILKQMTAKMKIEPAKLPSNIVGIYGNTSSVTVPQNMAHNFGAELEQKSHRVLMSAFGTGLSWATMVMNLGPLAACKIMDYEPV